MDSLVPPPNIHTRNIYTKRIVAIDYSSTRTFSEDPQYHLIYDMGAGSTTATVVSFASRSVKEGKTNKTVIEIATHGIGFDRLLGGDLFNERIVNHLVDTFRSSKSGAKAKTDIKSDGRAFARLFKEASRVKHVLSANTDTTAMVSRPLCRGKKLTGGLD